MRAILITTAILLTALNCVAQDASSLRKKYGEPKIESYQVRDEAMVTVAYDNDHAICEMVIQPKPDSTAKAPSFRWEQLTKLLDELVPSAGRGKYLMGEFFDVICLPRNNCYGTGGSYEKLSIYRNGSTDEEKYARIRWARASCKNVNIPLIAGTEPPF